MSVCYVEGCDKKVNAAGLCNMHYMRVRRRGTPDAPPPRKPSGDTIKDRFLAKVARGKGCWEFTGFKDARGYGRLNLHNKPVLAHRVSYEIFKGQIPEGMKVRHKCDNPGCVRPDHLEIGTQADNVADMWTRGRANPGTTRGIDHPKNKLTEDQVREIRASSESQERLAARFGVRQSSIWAIINRKSWKHLD